MTNTLKNKKLVVLLGAHRSGTSLAAHVLGRLGLPLGDDLLPGHADNPEGFHEHRGILAETKAIEEKLGVNAFSGVRFLPPEGEWWNSGEFAENIDGLRRVLRQELQNRSVFGFKDPRTLLLLPLWQKIIAAEGLEPVYIVLMRHPEAVARSVAKRQGLKAIHGEYVWTGHWSYAVSHLKKRPDAVLHYENWFSEPEKQIAMARALLGDQAIAADKAEAVVREIINPDLRHQGKTRGSAGLLPETIALYSQLSAPPADSAWEQARKTAADFLERLAVFTPVYESVAERAKRIEQRLLDCASDLAGQQERMRQLVAVAATGTGNGGNEASSGIKAVEARHLEFPDLTAFIKSVSGPGKKLKVCIATEDIVGPIRNGGIGTTYTHLAKFLAKAGHDTHILYLRSEYCENKSLEYWVEYYRQFNVNFVPLDSSRHPIESSAPRWLQPMYAMYEYLKNEHFDLVHVSEWHGSGYLSLAAKKQGLAFRDTLFCVKTSSPWLWNREYGLHTIQDIADLPKMYAEQQSVELADMVIGGSRDLLCWMVEHGYRLPERHVYVQPNVMIPLDIDDLAEKRRQRYGNRIKVNEIVFFGRLEYRKGLDIFFDAVEILINKGIALPRIYLMGKYGERIPSYSELSIPEYIAERSKKWPVKIEILSDYNNEEALRFLLGGKRLAVMPSIIENSSLAVYETAYYGIPFVASNSGGTPELILEKDQPEVLTNAHPVPLAEKIEEALHYGGFIARPSFSNERNLATWLRFHSAAGSYIASWRESGPGENAQGKPTVSICLVVSDDHEYAREVVERTAAKLAEHEAEIIIVDNGSARPETLEWLSRVQATPGGRLTVDHQKGWGEQHAQNHAAVLARGDLLVFPGLGTLLKENYLEVVRTAAAHSRADILCCFYDELLYEDFKAGSNGGVRYAVMPEDSSYGFYDIANMSPVLAVRKEAFRKIGGFDEIYKVPGADLELLSKAHLASLYIVTIPEAIAWRIQDFPAAQRLNEKALPYRSIRQYCNLAPHGYNRILMTARGISNTRYRGQAAAPIRIAAADAPDFSDVNTRELSLKLGHYPRLRSMSLWAYNFQVRIFRRLIRFEINTMSSLFTAWKKFRAKQ